MRLATSPTLTKYRYADYRAWPEGERWELIEGVAHAMASPSRLHQKIVFELGVQLGNYLRGKSCEAYVAPFDVLLAEADALEDDIPTVVQPDVLVVCDTTKLGEKACRGAPDWVIEVLSPTTALRDMNTKRDLYERHGVREYWLVHPTEHWVMIYALDAQGHYGKGRVLGMDEPTRVGLFTDLQIDWGLLGEGITA